MGILDSIKYSQIKHFVKGACKSMLFSFNISEAEAKRGKTEFKLYSDLAIKSLSTRPGWKKVNEYTFRHSSGEELKIKKDDSLANVTLNVILVEMKEFIFNDKQPEVMLKTIIEEFQNFFKVSDEFLEKHELLKSYAGLMIADQFIKKDFYN